MLQASRSCARVASTSSLLQRHISPKTNAIASFPGMSTSSGSKASKSTKKSAKTNNPTTAPISKGASAAAEEPVEKGDNYKAGESYFSYDPYSFYDIENSVQPQRCPQPSSDKASKY